MSVIIRQGVPADAGAAFALIHALAVHESCVDDLKIDAQAFEEAAITGRLDFMIAELENTIVGVVTYVRRFHIWNNSDYLHLDDLFVSPTARGHGVGTKLLAALGQQAKSKGMPVKWEVNQDNEGAIRLYERMGARVSIKGVCWWTPENIPD